MTLRALLASGALLVAAATPGVLAQTHVSEPETTYDETSQSNEVSQDWYQFDILLFSQDSLTAETELSPPVTDHVFPHDAVTLYSKEQLSVRKEFLPQPIVEEPAEVPKLISEPAPELADASSVSEPVSSGAAVPAELLGEPTPTAAPVIAEQQASFEYYEDSNNDSLSSDTAIPAARELTDRVPDIDRDPFILLPESMSGLNSQARSLRRSKGYKLLWQASFRMPVEKGDQPTPIRIQAGPKLGRNHEIEGVIALSQKRFLHADANLWINTMNPIYPLEQIVAGSPILIGVGSTGGEDNIRSGSGIDDDMPFWPADTRFYTKNMPVVSSKRLQVSKLNYIDHPNLGILIKVSPYQRPSNPD